jgi:hypothetical protein
MERLQQSRIRGFHGVASVLQQRPIEYDRHIPSKMIGLGYSVYGSPAVQRLCTSTLHCIEADLYPLRCDAILRTMRELRPIGIIYFYLGSFLLIGLLVIALDDAAFTWTFTKYRAVKLPNPCTRWIVLTIGAHRCTAARPTVSAH